MVLEETAGPCQFSLDTPQTRARLLEHTDLGPYFILIRQGLVVLSRLALVRTALILQHP
jgi:hypothetical protein